MIKTAKFRISVTKSDHDYLDRCCETSKDIYNAALQERTDAYRLFEKTIKYNNQTQSLTELRKLCPEYKEYPVSLLRGALKRIDRAMSAFFARVEENKAKGLKNRNVGYPKYKSHFNSFEFNQFGNSIRIKGNKIIFAGHSFRIKTSKHHQLPPYKIKTVTFKKKNKKWYIFLTYKEPDQTYNNQGIVLGIDMGITHLATTSKGDHIENKRFYEKNKKRLKAIDQQLAKSQKGSKRRKKAKEKRARLLEKIENQRKTYLHQVSRKLVDTYDSFAMEKLNISNMIRKKAKLGMQISDAGWYFLMSMINYKAKHAGKKIYFVDPRNTSQMCSGCGELVPKKRNEHHDCGHCGLVLDRDINAARNIGAEAVEGLSGHIVDV